MLTPTLAGPFGTLRSPRTGAKKAEAEAKKAEAKTKAMEVQLEAVKKMKEEKAKQKEMSRMMAALQTPSPKPCAKEGKTAEEVILHATPVSVKQSTEATDESTPEASYQSGSPPPSTGHTVQMMEQDAKALEKASAGSSIVSVPGSAPLHSVPAGGRTQSEQKLHEELEAVRSRSYYALLSI